jgi:hypothetical protein
MNVSYKIAIIEKHTKLPREIINIINEYAFFDNTTLIYAIHMSNKKKHITSQIKNIIMLKHIYVDESFHIFKHWTISNNENTFQLQAVTCYNCGNYDCISSDVICRGIWCACHHSFSTLIEL